MKKRYVYELVNLMGTVEYVGETKQPNKRFCEHVKWSRGKFYGRSDIFMNIVTEFDDRRDAYYYQCNLQKEYGLVTDRERVTRKHTNESKRKIGLSSKGRMLGKIHKPETIEKMKQARNRYWEMKKLNNN